jgi:uncharacterized protein (DUF1697 family)
VSAGLPERLGGVPPCTWRHSQAVLGALRGRRYSGRPGMTYIALLRAVNLGGRNMVAMAALRELILSLGFGDVRTLLQSGNVVFRDGTPLRRSGRQGPRRSTSTIAQTLQDATVERLGVATEYIVRTAPEWNAIIEANPFPGEAERLPNHLLLTALRDEPSRAAATALEEAIPGRERIRIIGRHAYIVYVDGVGRSRLTNALIEKTLATRATARNWNTVLKLAALAGE